MPLTIRHAFQMDLPHYILRLLLIVATCLLASCIDGREEIWLNADGSGRADIRYSLPAAAAGFQGGEAGVRRMIGGFLKNTPAIASSSYEVTTEEDRLKIRVRASFDSALDLKAIANGDSIGKLPSSAGNLAGEVTVNVQGLTVDFCRTISAGKALPGSVFMPASNFEGRNLTYIVHLPKAASETNATRTQDEGRTLIWDFPLARAIKGPVTTRFKARIPIPAWLLGPACVAALSTGLLAFFGIRKLRTAWQTER